MCPVLFSVDQQYQTGSAGRIHCPGGSALCKAWRSGSDRAGMVERDKYLAVVAVGRQGFASRANASLSTRYALQKSISSSPSTTDDFSTHKMIRQTADRIDPKRRNVISHKKKQFAQATYKQQEYPHRLSLYEVPPTAEITLEQFEQWAIDRLRGTIRLHVPVAGQY